RQPPCSAGVLRRNRRSSVRGSRGAALRCRSCPRDSWPDPAIRHTGRGTWAWHVISDQARHGGRSGRSHPVTVALEVEARIRCSRAVVFAALADLEHYPEWLIASGVRGVTLLDDSPLAAGSQLRL